MLGPFLEINPFLLASDLVGLFSRVFSKTIMGVHIASFIGKKSSEHRTFYRKIWYCNLKKKKLIHNFMAAIVFSRLLPVHLLSGHWAQFDPLSYRKWAADPAMSCQDQKLTPCKSLLLIFLKYWRLWNQSAPHTCHWKHSSERPPVVLACLPVSMDDQLNIVSLIMTIRCVWVAFTQW